MIDLDRVSDLELLRTVAKVQDAEIRRLHQQLGFLTEKIAKSSGADAESIKEQLALLKRDLEQAYENAYQKGSERRPRPKPDEPKAAAPKKGHGPKPQPQLPIVEAVHELDEADRVCTQCGLPLIEWEGQTEDSEEVDVVEVQYVLKKHQRKKYRCQCGGCIETALGPDKLIKGGRYSLNFAVHVAIEKYCFHMPLERQVKRMAKGGLQVETQTLWDQLFALARCFQEPIKRLHQHLLSKDVLIGDESHWPLLGATGHSTKNWYDWLIIGEDAVLHSILESRSNDAADKVLIGFEGTLLTDGYVVYDSRSRALGFKLARDWTHARRKFLEAEQTAPNEATPILDDIGKLFLIEREIAERFEGMVKEEALALRATVRQERSKPIVQRIGEQAQRIRGLRESPIVRAVYYLENQWDGLILFLDDPAIPITSNAAEAALRCLVLGRNNHFGSKSKRGTEVAALFYSLIESAKMNGLDPAQYLRCGAQAHLRGQRVPLPHELKLIATVSPEVAGLVGPAEISPQELT